MPHLSSKPCFCTDLDRSPLHKFKFSAILGIILIVILWRIVYSAFGHGAYGSDFVIDPVREPFRFVVKVLERAPFLLMAPWSCLPAEIASYLPNSEKINAWLVSSGFLLFLMVTLKPLLLKNRIAKFWYTAMLFSVLPICATLPMNRNLLFVAIGAFALIAQFVESLRTKKIGCLSPDSGVCRHRSYA